MDTIPELHHILSSSPNSNINLKKLVYDLHACRDPAIKVRNPVSVPTTTRGLQWPSSQDDFISRLKDHLLLQLYQYEYDGDEHQFSAVQHSHLHFVNNLNHIIELKTICVNYTSYDSTIASCWRKPKTCFVLLTISWGRFAPQAGRVVSWQLLNMQCKRTTLCTLGLQVRFTPVRLHHYQFELCDQDTVLVAHLSQCLMSI